MALPQPLAGMRVVEIGERLAAAYCGKLLRDAGADVVKIERGQGDPLRRYRPAGGGDIAPGADSAFFCYLAAGKRSIALAEGAAPPKMLVADADIVVLAASPAEAAAMGLDVAELTGTPSSRSVVTVSNFGWSGPWADYPATEFTLQAWCGSTGSRGTPDRPPIAVGGDLGEFITGGYAAFFGLIAHYTTARGGPGVHIDLSVLETLSQSMQTFGWLRRDVAGLQSFSRTIEIPSIERAKDGYVGVSMATDQQWLDFCDMVDCPHLAEDQPLRLQLGRWHRRDVVRDTIGSWFRARTVAEIVEAAAAHRVPMVPIGNGATLPEMSHFKERDVFVRNPSGFRQPRPPWLMSAAAPRPAAAAPGLGEANGHVDDLWAARGDRRTAPDGPPDPARPLRGLRIIDLTAFWAGPAATQLLATLGADVVKLESIQRPDGLRHSGKMRTDVQRWWEYSWVFHPVNTNKKSLTLNLRSEAGRQLLGRLAARADIVIENFPARVMEQLGLDYQTLRRGNDGLIFVRMPAFGLDGPWRDRGGFAMTMEQIAGLAWLTGYPDEVPTTPRGPCDALAAAHAAFVSMCAIEHRRRNGQGQLVEIPMIETVLNAAALQVIEHDTTGKLLHRRGNRGHQYAVQNLYACAGHEQWIAISMRDDGDWAAVRELVGLAGDIGSDEYATEEGRWAHEAEVDHCLARWLCSQPLMPTVEALLAAGVPAAPVVLPTDIGDNPQLRARGFLETVSHPLCGPIRYPRPPIGPLPNRAHFVDRPAPTLGEHNSEVLGAELELAPQDLEKLRAEQVIGTRPTSG